MSALSDWKHVFTPLSLSLRAKEGKVPRLKRNRDYRYFKIFATVHKEV